MSAGANLIEESLDNPRGPLHTRSACSSAPDGTSVGKSIASRNAGVLIINADDWGRDHETTQRIFECSSRGSISSVSAMVFMEDSERAAAIARESAIDAGLHLNFTTPFSVSNGPAQLKEFQSKLAAHLRRHRLAQIIYDPRLTGCFEYLVAAQVDEFHRLYGAAPKRLDGHHHMHLCANVLWGRLLPEGTVVRRNFSFRPGEKSLGNRLYRGLVDRMLARRHRIVDFLFSLAPLEPADRLQGIFSLARQHAVELETHPVDPEEYEFLGDEVFRRIGDLSIASHYAHSKMTNEPAST
jgi:chitin disaccharide deacetylase